VNRFLLSAFFFSSFCAAQTGWIPPQPPEDVCKQVEKNVRAMYIAWASGAKETFNDLKREMRDSLSGKAGKEEQVKALYEKVFARIEANDFSEPNYPDRVSGHLAAKKFAAETCASQIKID
jgi:hypothetical protein